MTVEIHRAGVFTEPITDVLYREFRENFLYIRRRVARSDGEYLEKSIIPFVSGDIRQIKILSLKKEK